jgi:hypothetical protein
VYAKVLKASVHEKNMEKMFPTKKLIIFIIIINGNTM